MREFVSILKDKVQFLFYRIATISKSLKALYSLPREKVDAFLDSLRIFDYDWADQEKMLRDMGPEYYGQIKQKLVDYYCVINHLCALGQVEKMYIPPVLDLSKGIIANQDLFEKKMAQDLCLKKRDAVLDIGCGRGRVAGHITSLTEAHITGINLDSNQLENALQYATEHHLNERCQFKLWDLNNLPFPFPDESMNAVYEIQAFSYSKNLEHLFQEIYRILKPGGKLACLDWFCLDKYNPNNPEHVDLVRRIKPLIGAIGTPSVDQFVNAIRKAGFKILINENASIDGKQAPLIENAGSSYAFKGALFKALVRCKIIPRHIQELFDSFKNVDAFIEADRKGLATTSHYIIAEK